MLKKCNLADLMAERMTNTMVLDLGMTISFYVAVQFGKLYMSVQCQCSGWK